MQWQSTAQGVPLPLSLTVALGAGGPRPHVARVVRTAVEKRQDCHRPNWNFVIHSASQHGIVRGREKRLAQAVEDRAAQGHGCHAASVENGSGSAGGGQQDRDGQGCGRAHRCLFASQSLLEEVEHGRRPSA